MRSSRPSEGHNPYADRATNLIYAWEKHYSKNLTVGDREGLHMMITEALQEAAWAAQQPYAWRVTHPKE